MLQSRQRHMKTSRSPLSDLPSVVVTARHVVFPVPFFPIMHFVPFFPVLFFLVPFFPVPFFPVPFFPVPFFQATVQNGYDPVGQAGF